MVMVELVYVLYIELDSLVQFRGWAPSGGLQDQSREMINGAARKKKQSYATRMCIHFLHICTKYWRILPHWAFKNNLNKREV